MNEKIDMRDCTLPTCDICQVEIPLKVLSEANTRLNLKVYQKFTTIMSGF